jgi:hypothetical protein
MKTRKPIKALQVKVHVTAKEKEELQVRAKAAGLSLSRYLSAVGLARQLGVAAERSQDHVILLEMVLSRLNTIAEGTADRTADSLMVLEQLCLLERHIIMLAPSIAVRKLPAC